MSCIFDSDFLFDPMDRLEDDSFLTFSSLSEFSSPPLFDGFDSKPPLSGAASDISSPTPSAPHEIVTEAYGDDIVECGSGDIGIFHTPTRRTSNNSDNPETISWTERSSGSSDTLGTPLTPSLSSLPVDQYTFGAAGHAYYLPPNAVFSWDESTPSLGAGYSPATTSHQPHRIASNPVIGSARRSRIKQVVSMPALREEDQGAGVEYFGRGAVSFEEPSHQAGGGMGDVHEEALVEGLHDVFGDFGLVEPRLQTFTFDADSAQSQSVDMMPTFSHHSAISPNSFPPTDTVPPWQLAMQAAVGTLPSFTFPPQLEGSQPMSQCHTVDPMAVMTYRDPDDDSSRPVSAPGSHGGERDGMLSVPKSESMSKRSLSSSGYAPSSRSAPPRALFSYAPQAYYEGPPEPQPLYTSNPHHLHNSSPFSSLPRSMPRTPTPRSLSGRTVANGLTIVPPSPDMLLFRDTGYPPTPTSDDVFYSRPYGATIVPTQSLSQPQPISMQRAETTPNPGTHARSVSDILPSPAGSSATQAHGAGAGSESSHKRTRRVSETEAFALRGGQQQQQQPLFASRPQTISSLMAPAKITPRPILTHTPLISVHPPPAQYVLTGTPGAPHRVHPPPHPGHAGGMGRPIARLPSPSRRKVSAYTQMPVTPSMTTSPYLPVTPQRRAPKARSPSSRMKSGALGVISFGDDMFVNFTMEDGEALLNGVAPSGSSGKRRREDGGKTGLVEDGERSKRSRSNE